MRGRKFQFVFAIIAGVWLGLRAAVAQTVDGTGTVYIPNSIDNATPQVVTLPNLDSSIKPL